MSFVLSLLCFAGVLSQAHAALFVPRCDGPITLAEFAFRLSLIGMSDIAAASMIRDFWLA